MIKYISGGSGKSCTEKEEKTKAVDEQNEEP